MMRESFTPLGALGLLLLATAPVAWGQPGMTCAGLELSAPSQTSTSTFSATRVVDITVKVHVNSGLNGPHVLQLRFTTPQGHLYQAIDIPVADPGSPATVRNLPGYPFAIPEARPVATSFNSSPTYAIQTRFPVGGTAIVANGLYGKWAVAAYADGSPVPCSAKTPFTITR